VPPTSESLSAAYRCQMQAHRQNVTLYAALLQWYAMSDQKLDVQLEAAVIITRGILGWSWSYAFQLRAKILQSRAGLGGGVIPAIPRIRCRSLAWSHLRASEGALGEQLDPDINIRASGARLRWYSFKRVRCSDLGNCGGPILRRRQEHTNEELHCHGILLTWDRPQLLVPLIYTKNSLLLQVIIYEYKAYLRDEQTRAVSELFC